MSKIIDDLENKEKPSFSLADETDYCITKFSVSDDKKSISVEDSDYTGSLFYDYLQIGEIIAKLLIMRDKIEFPYEIKIFSPSLIKDEPI